MNAWTDGQMIRAYIFRGLAAAVTAARSLFQIFQDDLSRCTQQKNKPRLPFPPQAQRRAASIRFWRRASGDSTTTYETKLVPKEMNATAGWGVRPFELATLRLQNLVSLQLKHRDALKHVDERCLTQLGGCTVVGAGGETLYSWLDQGLCDVPDMHDLLESL